LYLSKKEFNNYQKIKIEFVLKNFNELTFILIKANNNKEKYQIIIDQIFKFLMEMVFEFSEEKIELSFNNDEKKADYGLKEIFYEKICKVYLID